MAPARHGEEATGMSVRLLISFVSCATLLVLGEASTLSDEGQVVQCSKTKVKGLMRASSQLRSSVVYTVITDLRSKEGLLGKFGYSEP